MSVEAPVLLARPLAAIRARYDQIARAGVEYYLERLVLRRVGLGLRADHNLAVELSHRDGLPLVVVLLRPKRGLEKCRVFLELHNCCINLVRRKQQ